MARELIYEESNLPFILKEYDPHSARRGNMVIHRLLSVRPEIFVFQEGVEVYRWPGCWNWGCTDTDVMKFYSRPMTDVHLAEIREALRDWPIREWDDVEESAYDRFLGMVPTGQPVTYGDMFFESYFEGLIPLADGIYTIQIGG